MTLPYSLRRAGPFSGTGVLVAFPFTFKVFAKTDVSAQLTVNGVTTTPVQDSDYTISLNADQEATPGGYIQYTLAVGATLTLLGSLPYDQPTDLPAGGAYRAQVVENALDRIVIQTQQLAESADRSLRAPLGEVLTALPNKATRANTIQGYDSNGDPTVVVPVDGSAASVLITLAAPTGSAAIGHQAAYAGAVAETVREALDEGDLPMVRFFSAAQKADVAAGTLAIDCHAAVLTAIVVARIAKKKLIWPGGKILITKSLNCTQFGSSATEWEGAGFDYDMSSGTVVVVRSAADGSLSPGWCADFTGSQNITIKGINFWGNGANAATKGLLFARSFTYRYAQQIKLDKVCVRLPTAPAATAVGSVALVNCCAEQFVEEHCTFEGDVGAVYLLNNELSVRSAWLDDTANGYPLGVYTGILSMTVVQSRQTTYTGLTGSAMMGYGVASSSWLDCVWARAAGNTTLQAINLNSGTAGYLYPQRLKFSGQVEGYPGGLTLNSASMDAYAIETDLFMAAASAATAYVVTAANVIQRQCRFNNQQASNLAGQVALSLGASNTLIGGETVLYPGCTVSLNSATNRGHRINYHGNDTGLQNLTAGANITALGAPNAPSSWLDSEGVVHLAGLLQATAVIAGGVTVATVAAAHRPTRTINGACFMSGIGLAYYTLTSAGLLSVGTATINGTQIDLSGISFKAAN